MKITIIYLAAGNSRRFGSNKLFYEVNGRPMYRHLLERLMNICSRHEDWQLRVVSQYRELLTAPGQSAAVPVYSPDSSKGASYSIKAGLNSDRNGQQPEAEAYAFFVADQPWLSEETAEAFLLQMEKEKALLGSVCHAGVPGNPTWFSAGFVPELMALSGDWGGRAVLRNHPELVSWFEVKEKRELLDLDLPGQLL